MGLDITIREYIGNEENGELIMREPLEELTYLKDRLRIRHELSDNIQFIHLRASDYYSHDEYYRPKDFEEAYKWCNTLENTSDKNYVKTLLDSLNKNENYWLEYSR